MTEEVSSETAFIAVTGRHPSTEHTVVIEEDGKLPRDPSLATKCLKACKCACCALLFAFVLAIVVTGLLCKVICCASEYECQYMRYVKMNPIRPGSSILLSMNTSLDPCDNFYIAACGQRLSLADTSLSIHMQAVASAAIAPVSSGDLQIKTILSLQAILESSNESLLLSHAFNQTRALFDACKSSGTEAQTCLFEVWNLLPSAVMVVHVLHIGFTWSTYEAVRSIFERVRAELERIVGDGPVKSWVSNTSLSLGGVEDAWKADERFRTTDLSTSGASLAVTSGVEIITLYERSLNYGGLGTLIGHELSHAAIKGSLHDYLVQHLPSFDRLAGDVVLRVDPFVFAQMLPAKRKAAQLVSVYSEFATNRATASLTKDIVEEFLADFLGVQASFNAFRKDPANEGPLVPSLASLTKDQLFFYNYAMSHCDKPDTEPSKTHPADEFRVNGILSVLPEFARAFNCPVGSPMNRG